MSEAKRRKTLIWRVRLWVGENLGILLVLVVTAYLAGFFLYHAYSTVATLIWQESTRYAVGDSCTLLIEYPNHVTLGPTDQPGHPITLWLWSEQGMEAACSASLTAAVSAPYSVNLGPLGAGLEFTDSEGNLAPAQIPLQLAASASTAVPARLYVRRAPSAGLSAVQLDVGVEAVDAAGNRVALPLVLQGAVAPVVRPESVRTSRWRHFVEVLFNPGPLQWMFTAVAGIVGVWEVYKELQRRRDEKRDQAVGRRRIQRERIAALQDVTPAERAFHAYLSLHAEFQEEADVLEELRNAFQASWMPYLRYQLGHYLRVGRFADASAFVEEMWWEWRQSTTESTRGSVRNLIRHLQQPAASPPEEVLRQVLAGFHTVGLEATQPIVDWLAATRPDPELARQILFQEGAAGGHHLLRQWAERDSEVAHLLLQWERDTLPSVGLSGRVATLWARERGESRILQQGVQRLGLDLNPFGPSKAEQDPLLPDLFYRLSPVWEEVSAPQPSIFVAPPGCGRTALIWMLRYGSGLVGSAVETVFPAFVPLHPFSSVQELAQVLQRAITSALCSFVVRDPYALLGLAEVERHSLAALMLRSAGGLAALLQQLRSAGLRADDPDGQLLQEALYIVTRSQEQWESGAEWDVPRFHPYPMEYTYLLIDVAFQEPDVVDALLKALFQRWLPSMMPRHVVAKVFLHERPAYCPLSPVQFQWDNEDLYGLLRHRVERAGLVLHEDQPLLDGWVDGQSHPETVLIERSGGCPSRVITLGNRLIRRLAQPQSLSSDEFLEIMRR